MGKRDHTINNDIRKEAHIKPVETFLENRSVLTTARGENTTTYMCKIAEATLLRDAAEVDRKRHRGIT